MTNTVTRTAPARIWLQVSDEAGDLGEPFPAALDSAVTWCQDSVMGCEVEYVRADLASGYQVQEPLTQKCLPNGIRYLLPPLVLTVGQLGRLVVKREDLWTRQSRR